MTAAVMLESPVAYTCGHVAFDTREEAVVAARDCMRRVGGRLVPRMCALCGHYLVTFDCKFNPMRVEIIRQIALGFRGAEIARDMGITPNVLYIQISKMCKEVNATSISHLVAMAMLFGIVDITEPPAKDFNRGTYS